MCPHGRPMGDVSATEGLPREPVGVSRFDQVYIEWECLGQSGIVFTPLDGAKANGNGTVTEERAAQGVELYVPGEYLWCVVQVKCLSCPTNVSQCLSLSLLPCAIILSHTLTQTHSPNPQFLTWYSFFQEPTL